MLAQALLHHGLVSKAQRLAGIHAADAELLPHQRQGFLQLLEDAHQAIDASAHFASQGPHGPRQLLGVEGVLDALETLQSGGQLTRQLRRGFLGDDSQTKIRKGRCAAHEAQRGVHSVRRNEDGAGHRAHENTRRP